MTTMSIATATPLASDIDDLSKNMLSDVACSLISNILLTKSYLENAMMYAIASDHTTQYLLGCKKLTVVPRCGMKVLSELFRSSGLYALGADVAMKYFSDPAPSGVSSSWTSSIQKGSRRFSDYARLPEWKEMQKSTIGFHVIMESDSYSMVWDDAGVHLYRKESLTPTFYSWMEAPVHYHAVKMIRSTSLSGIVVNTTVGDEIVGMYESPEGWSVMDNHDGCMRYLSILTDSDHEYIYQAGNSRGCPTRWSEELRCGFAVHCLLYNGDEGNLPADTMNDEKKIVIDWFDETKDICQYMLCETCGPSVDDSDMEGQKVRCRKTEADLEARQYATLTLEEVKRKMSRKHTYDRDGCQITMFVDDGKLGMAVHHLATGVLYYSFGSYPTARWSYYCNPITKFESSTGSADMLLDSEMKYISPLVKAYYSLYESVDKRDLIRYYYPSFMLRFSAMSEGDDRSRLEFKISQGSQLVTVVATTVESSSSDMLGGLASLFGRGASSMQYTVSTDGKKTLDLKIDGSGEYKIGMGIPGETISKESFLVVWRGGVNAETKQPHMIKMVLPKQSYPAGQGQESSKISQNRYHQFADDEHFLKFSTQQCYVDSVWPLRPFYRCATKGCNRIALYISESVTGDVEDTPLGHVVCVSCSSELKNARLVDIELYWSGDGKDEKVVAVSPFVATDKALAYAVNTMVRAQGEFKVNNTDCTQHSPGVYFFLTRDRVYDYVYRNCVLLEQTSST
jgi:hypothetical protein